MDKFPAMPGEYSFKTAKEGYRTVVAVDPSGNFENGHGHTGIAILQIENGVPNWEGVEVISIDAEDYRNRHDYWSNIIWTIHANLHYAGSVIALEKYVVRNNGFTIGKSPETAMLLGAIHYELGPDYTIVEQTPSQAKRRYPDSLLGKIFPTLEQRANKRWYLNSKCVNEHCRDALRHLAYCINYNI